MSQLLPAFEAPADNKAGPAAELLVRKRKPRVAHIWTGQDTACRMASTGGLDAAHYSCVATTALPLCSMCQAVAHGAQK